MDVLILYIICCDDPTLGPATHQALSGSSSEGLSRVALMKDGSFEVEFLIFIALIDD